MDIKPTLETMYRFPPFSAELRASPIKDEQLIDPLIDSQANMQTLIHIPTHKVLQLIANHSIFKIFRFQVAFCTFFVKFPLCYDCSHRSCFKEVISAAAKLI